jgi:prepilin-type N-terminal cleavage/methylation domain-containing protein
MGAIFMSNRRGFTLIEMIISIAIIGVIAVAFLPLFTTSFKWIADAGRRSDTLFNSQDASEEKILQGASTNAGHLNFDFTFSDGTGAVNIQVEGEHVQNDTLYMFIPSN